MFVEYFPESTSHFFVPETVDQGVQHGNHHPHKAQMLPCPCPLVGGAGLWLHDNDCPREDGHGWRWDAQMEVDFFLPSAEHVRATAMHVKREEVRMTRRVKKTLKLTTKKTASLLMACFGAPESQEWWDVAEKVIDFIWTTGESEAVCRVDRGTEEATEVKSLLSGGHTPAVTVLV